MPPALGLRQKAGFTGGPIHPAWEKLWNSQRGENRTWRWPGRGGGWLATEKPHSLAPQLGKLGRSLRWLWHPKPLYEVGSVRV